MKKNNASTFDVTMGSFDGAEVCELVGVYMLHELTAHVGRAQIGLYRDDGLAVLRNTTGSAAERIRKSLTAVFAGHGLKVTIDTNLKVVNFLDVTFNLSTGGYMPHRKPGDTPQYINTHSNHPPSIIKQLPAGISRRVSTNSSSEEAFNEAAPMYNNALSASGYAEGIEYMGQPAKKNRKRNRKRKITWFNPPFSRSVRTNVAAAFLTMIDRHFKNTPLKKIFNRHNVKVSYSCMPNIAAIISGHNKRQLIQEPPEKPCNCRKKQECPMEGRCQASHIIYEAHVTSQDELRTYIGSAETTFKTRYNNHTMSFRHEKYRTNTELSKHLWKKKNDDKEYHLSWRIKDKASSYNPATKRCCLCTTEKVRILTADKTKILNKRSEIIAKCRHANKYRLAKYNGIT